MTVEELPKLYRLVELEQADSALAEAARRAEQGAEEGLLVRVRTQTAAVGRRGQPWRCSAGGLYAGLVLRPEEPPRVAAQLALVAAVALGSAIAEHVAPPAELHYRWPNDVLLNQAKVASVQMEQGAFEADSGRWLVLGLYANVASAPDGPDFDAAALQVEGACEATASQLLVSFARHFLVAVDRWVNEGFASVRKAWLHRAHGIGDEVSVVAAGHTHSGRMLDLADDGALLLGRGGAVERLTIGDAYGFQERP